MAGREGPYRRDFNSTNYIHPNEENLFNLHKAMDYNSLGQPVIRTAISAREVPTANTAFGEPVAIEPTPIVQVESIYELDTDEVQTFSGGGGVVGRGNSMFYAESSTTAYSYAVLRTRRVVKYRPGQGAMTRFTAMFDPKAGTTLRVGPANQEEAVQVGFNGTRFGVFHSRGGKAEIRTITVTAGPAASTNATIVLNGVSYTVPLVSGETTVQTAARIARFTYTGWITEQKDSDVRFLTAGGVGPITGTFSFSHATATATVSRTQAGVAATETWTYQEDFTVDSLDGNGESGVTLDLTKLNVFQINFRWLGAGGVTFSVQHPETGVLMRFHAISWSGNNSIPWADNPGFKITYTAYNLGGTQAARISGSSMAGFIEGMITRNNYTRSYSLQKTSLASGSMHHVFTIRNPLIYQGKINTKEIILTDISLAHQGNDPLQVALFFNAPLVADGDIYARLPEAVALVNTVTGTIDLNSYTPVVSFVLGINGNGQFDLTGYRFVLPPGTDARIAVKSGQNISQISAALVWLAD